MDSWSRRKVGCDDEMELIRDLPEGLRQDIKQFFCLDLIKKIIDLMLKRCNALPLVNVPCSISLAYALLIQFVLLHLSYMEHLNLWARGDSLIKLIFLLCMWEAKPILDSARLLAQYTDSINNIARTFVECGALIQFGALLLIAREKVTAPFDTVI